MAGRGLKVMVLLGLLSLSACGFRPLYGTMSETQSMTEVLSTIEIEPIADRLGQMMENQLAAALQPQGMAADNRYQLKVSLSEARRGLGFRNDGAITRERYDLTAAYQLLDNSTGNVLLEESLSAGSSYDIVLSDFANFSAFENAQERAVERLSQSLALQLALYFRQTEAPQ